MKFREQYLELSAKAFLFLTAFISIFPFSVTYPNGGLDPSWVLGMAEAVSEGMDIGQDIIFTFGPYAFIYTKLYTPSTATGMYVSSFFLAIVFGLVLLRLFQRESVKVVLFFSLIIAVTSFSRDALFFLFIFSLGLLISKKINSSFDLNESDRGDYFLISVGLVAISILPLVKGTLLILGFGIWGMAIILTILISNKKLLLAYLLTPLLSLPLFWAVSGQKLILLDDYFVNILPIISGYSAAMSIPGPIEEVVGFIVLSAIVCYLWVSRFSRNNLVTLLASIFVISFFIVALKSGLVRHDGHKIISYVFLGLASFLMAVTARSRALGVVSVFCVFCSLLIAHGYSKTSFINVGVKPVSFYSSSVSGFLRYFNGEVYIDEYEKSLKKLADEFPFPNIDGSVDVYPWDQATLIAANKEWSPRPVFQSYSAYTDTLINKNVEHLRSRSAPDLIIHSIKTIDGRYPLLDDGLSFVEILKNYDASEYVDGFILFERNIDSSYQELSDFSSNIDSGAAELAQEVDLPLGDKYYFLKLDLNNSLMGSIANALYKPPGLKLIVNGVSGWTKSFRLIPDSSRTGFIISPFIDSSDSLVVGLLKDNFEGQAVKSFSVEVDGWSWAWNESYDYEIYELDLNPSERLGIRYEDLGYEKASLFKVKEDEQIEFVSSDGCIGSVDSFNKSENLLTARGWLGEKSRVEPVNNPMIIVVDDGEVVSVIPTSAEVRKDVGDHFDKSVMSESGFSVKIVLDESSSLYTYLLGYYQDDKLHTCENLLF